MLTGGVAREMGELRCSGGGDGKLLSPPFLWAGPRGRCVAGKPAQWGPREGLAAPLVSGTHRARPSLLSLEHGSRVPLAGCPELGMAPWV